MRVEVIPQLGVGDSQRKRTGDVLNTLIADSVAVCFALRWPTCVRQVGIGCLVQSKACSIEVVALQVRSALTMESPQWRLSKLCVRFLLEVPFFIPSLGSYITLSFMCWW